jgi:uncharacterized membrane protein
MLLPVVLCSVIVFSVKHQKTSFRYYWAAILCVLCALVAMKATHAFHEVLYAAVDAVRAGNWLLIGAAGLAAGAIVSAGVLHLVPFLASLSWTVKRQIIVAVCVYLIGTIVLEEIGESVWYITHNANLIYEVLGSIEEFCEMAGFVLLQHALLQFLAEQDAGWWFKLPSVR